MKKLILLFITMTLCFGMFCTTALGAPEVKVTVDGKAISFTDAKPFVDENNRTQVPMRALGEALGCNVDYEYGDVLISKKSPCNNLRFELSFMGVNSPYYGCDYYHTNIISPIHKTDFGASSFAKDMDTSVIMKNNRVYLPARYIAEEFGYCVNWDSKNNTVIITTNTEAIINQTLCRDLSLDTLQGTWEVYVIPDPYYDMEPYTFKMFVDNNTTSVFFESLDGYSEANIKIDPQTSSGTIYVPSNYYDAPYKVAFDLVFLSEKKAFGSSHYYEGSGEEVILYKIDD